MDEIQPEKLILNINDRKAKRFGKSKYTEQLLTKSFFDKFRKAYPEYKKKDAEILKDWESISYAMASLIIEEPDGIQLGNNMGEMKLGLLRVHNVIDIKASAEAGKPIKYLNFHTNNKPAKMIWKTEFARRVHFFLSYLGFRAVRKINKMCNEGIKQNGNQYKDVNKLHKPIK